MLNLINYPAAINTFQAAKASTTTDMQQHLVLPSISAHNLSELWICGAFALHLNLHNAQMTELLASMGYSCIKCWSGCKNAISPDEKQTVLEMVPKVNLSHYPE